MKKYIMLFSMLFVFIGISYSQTIKVPSPDSIKILMSDSKKFVKALDGYMYLTYEKDGGIYLISSHDNGKSWYPENAGHKLNEDTRYTYMRKNSAKNPTIVTQAHGRFEYDICVSYELCYTSNNSIMFATTIFNRRYRGYYDYLISGNNKYYDTLRNIAGYGEYQLYSLPYDKSNFQIQSTICKSAYSLNCPFDPSIQGCQVNDKAIITTAIIDNKIYLCTEQVFMRTDSPNNKIFIILTDQQTPAIISNVNHDKILQAVTAVADSNSYMAHVIYTALNSNNKIDVHYVSLAFEQVNTFDYTKVIKDTIISTSCKYDYNYSPKFVSTNDTLVTVIWANASNDLKHKCMYSKSFSVPAINRKIEQETFDARKYNFTYPVTYYDNKIILDESVPFMTFDLQKMDNTKYVIITNDTLSSKFNFIYSNAINKLNTIDVKKPFDRFEITPLYKTENPDEFGFYLYSYKENKFTFDSLSNYSISTSDIKITSGVKSNNNLPETFETNNYPNPFNPTTNISYSVPVAQNITIKVYSVLGKEITTLVNNEYTTAGHHKISFDATKFNLASGIYIYNIATMNGAITKKMMLIK